MASWPAKAGMLACFHDETRECFVFPHHVVRLTPNISNGHPTHSPIQPVEGLEPHLKRYKKHIPDEAYGFPIELR
jgi:hypothetical protein